MSCECCNKNQSANSEHTGNEPEFLEIATLKIPEPLYYAICVLNGRFGSGEDRKSALGSKYEVVQSIVNYLAQYYD